METSILVPLIVGVTEVAKKVFKLDSEYCPVLALIVGIFLAWVTNGDVESVVISGIVAGLTASGLYDNVKSGVKIFTDK